MPKRMKHTQECPKERTRECTRKRNTLENALENELENALENEQRLLISNCHSFHADESIHLFLDKPAFNLIFIKENNSPMLAGTIA